MASRDAGGRSAKEVTILTGRPGDVDEVRISRQPDQQIPVLEDRQLLVERSRPLDRLSRHQHGVKRDVVVEQQDSPVEVPAVGETASTLDPTALPRPVADHGRVGVGDVDVAGKLRREGLQVFRREHVVVVQETDAVPGRRIDAGLRRGRPASVVLEVDATHVERKVLRHLRGPAAVVHQDELNIAIGAPGQTVQCLRQPPRPVVGPNHDRHPTGRRDLDQRWRPTQVCDELRRTPGREIAGLQLAVALGIAARLGQAQRPETAEALAGRHVVVPFQLARVTGHGLRYSLHFGGHVHEQVGVERVVHLVAENAQCQIAGR